MGIVYGADYNPEQWLSAEGVVDEDLDLMAQAGVTMVSLGIFAWAKLEPTEGRYDLGWLRELMDRLWSRGISVDLATGTASPPAWFARKYPDSLPVSSAGRRLNFGSRQHYCPTSPDFRARAASLARVLALELGQHPGLKLWHVGNEYGCHVWECFCERCVRVFRGWLSSRYESIDALNNAWGTWVWAQRYGSFDEIDAPVAMPSFGNPGHVADWRRFTNDQLLECFLVEAGELRAITPAIPVTTNFMGAFPYLDYAQWALHIDVISDDSYPDPAGIESASLVAFIGDLMRGLGAEARFGRQTRKANLGKDTHARSVEAAARKAAQKGGIPAGGEGFILMEQAPSAVQWRGRNSPKRPGQFALWSLARVARGADAICQFQWRQAVAGNEAFHSGMLPHAGTDTRVWREVVDLGNTLSKIPMSTEGTDAQDVGREEKPELFPGPLTPATNAKPITGARAAMVMDWDSQWLRTASCGPVQEAPFASLRSWHRSFFEANIPVDIVRPGTDISGYDLVVVPQLWSLDDAFARRLEAAVRAGAQVLVQGPSGVVDRNNQAILDGYARQLSGLLGLHVTEHVASSAPYQLSPEALLASGETHDPDVVMDRISASITAPSGEFGMPLEITSDALRRTCDLVAKDAAVPFIELSGQIWAEDVQILNLAPDSNPTPSEMGTEILARFAPQKACRDLGGKPALTRKAQGKGAGWYVATDADRKTRAVLLRLLCAYAKITEPKMPAGVERLQRGDLTFYMNHSDKTVHIAGVSGQELLSATQASGTIVLPARSTAVVR
ncbi:MAG: beta-galactosidase [Actinomycetaceae bacterium]|nr:beta-galactosidase [Actinomycetaceae bacterium]